MNRITLLIITSIILINSTLFGQTPSELSQVVQNAADAVSASVVSIQPVGTEETAGETLLPEVTTGVFVSSDGYIVTSMLGFDPAPVSIIVRRKDGTILPGKLVAKDFIRKLVLLKVQADSCPVPAGVRKQEVKIGQWTIACGRVFPVDKQGKLPLNITVGILSATGRIWGRAIQTDAAVSPNNYGGPLIDLQGRVIGVLVPLSPESDSADAGTDWYDSGIGFAIPWEDITAVFPRLIKGETLNPGYGGFGSQEANPAIAEPILVEPPTQSPAAKAGLKKGDRVISVDGTPIQTFAQFRRLTASKTVGESVVIEYQRAVKKAGKEITQTSKTTVQLAQRPENSIEEQKTGLLEMLKKQQKENKKTR